MKHIAVNTRLLLPGRIEGIGRYAYEVLSRMVKQHPDIRFSFLFDRPFDREFVFGENVKAYSIPPPSRHPILWYTWFHLVLPWKLNRLKPDLFFSPEFYLTSHPSIPQIGVFHDLAYEHYPKDLPRFASWYCRRFSPIYAERANHILTVSKYVRQDISDHYGIPAEKITAIYNGGGDGFFVLDESEKQQVRSRYTNGAPYFHFVGAMHPRKNIETLLLAFDRFKQVVDSPVQLLLVGRKGWKYQKAMETYEQMQFRDAVKFTGFVSDEELKRIYAGSHGLCYIPYLEGFGLPIIEAMHAEIPVLCSNLTAMPEVAGEAALTVDPFDPDAVTQALIRLYKDSAYRAQLIQAGRVRRTQFSWDRTYKQVWEVLDKYLN